MDRRIDRLADPLHTGLRGAALLAGIALGEVERAEVSSLTPVERTFSPDPDANCEYERLFAEFPKLYKAQ